MAGVVKIVRLAWDVFWFCIHNAVHQITEGGTDKRGVPRRQLVQQAAQRPEV